MFFICFSEFDLEPVASFFVISPLTSLLILAIPIQKIFHFGWSKYDERYVGLVHLLYFLSCSVEIPVHENLQEFYLGKRSPFEFWHSQLKLCLFSPRLQNRILMPPEVDFVTSDWWNVITQQIESLMCSPTSRDALTGPLKNLMFSVWKKARE